MEEGGGDVFDAKEFFDGLKWFIGTGGGGGLVEVVFRLGAGAVGKDEIKPGDAVVGVDPVDDGGGEGGDGVVLGRDLLIESIEESEESVDGGAVG